MMERPAYSVLFLLCAIVLLAGCASVPPPAPERAEPSAADGILQIMFLGRPDLVIPAYTSPDWFSLRTVSRFFAAPVTALDFSASILDRFQTSPHDLVHVVATCGVAMDLPSAAPPGPVQDDKGTYAPQWRLYAALARAQAVFTEAFGDLSRQQAAAVRELLEQLLYSGRNQKGRSRLENQIHIERVFSLAKRIDAGRIIQACGIVARAVDDVVESLRSGTPLHAPAGSVTTAMGDIVIGGAGDDIHAGPVPLILIDTGGNDVYRFQGNAQFSVVIDCEGDDTYESSSSGRLGAGVLGMGFLVDMSGDDLYHGDDFCFGCGLLGAGVLADLAGNDRYAARLFCQGAAAFGMGLMYDARGDDEYRSDLYAQGFGYVLGAGVLVDLKGNDRFSAGTSVPDPRERSGAFQTYAQGFGMGCRPFASGGVGLLYDGEGDDVYNGSYFCQGASYWRALGLLIDAAGNDCYNARRYAQGAGVHVSAGMLLDAAGNDKYHSWGVSQGCGHDYALGVLHDRQGDDRYVSEWLSQGAGNDAGVGMLIDSAGRDAYRAGDGAGVQGAGVYDARRDAFSIGLLVDGAGADSFSRPGRHDRCWKQGELGGGIDSDGTLVPIWHGAYTAAGAGETGNMHPRDVASETPVRDWRIIPELEAPLSDPGLRGQASRLLAAQGPDILAGLLRYRALKDVAVQRAVEETLKKLAVLHREELHNFLKRPGTAQSDIQLLLYVLGDVDARQSIDVFLVFLDHEDPAIQAMALRGLYKAGASPPLKAIARLAGATEGSVRKYLCLALQHADNRPAAKILCRLLADDDPQVRRAAYKALALKKDASQRFLKAMQGRSDLLPFVRRMVDDLLQSGSS